MADFMARIPSAFDEVCPWVLGIGAVASVVTLLVAAPELLTLLLTLGVIKMVFPIIVLTFASFVFG